MLHPITQKKAFELFSESNAKYVSQEQCGIFYDHFDNKAGLLVYTAANCLAVLDCDYGWFIHALSGKSDLLSAIEEVKAVRDPDKDIFVFTLADVPESLEEHISSLKYVREYAPFEDDSIRLITHGDRDAVMRCCAPDPEDIPLGQHLAEEFIFVFNESDDAHLSDVNTYGLFCGDELAGFVQGYPDRKFPFLPINIYVKREYRRMGYAARLVSFLCSVSPEKMYCYSCAKWNTASVATAKSCGFNFIGAYLKL